MLRAHSDTQRGAEAYLPETALSVSNLTHSACKKSTSRYSNYFKNIHFNYSQDKGLKWMFLRFGTVWNCRTPSTHTQIPMESYSKQLDY